MDYGDVSFESLYQGGGSSFDPDAGNYSGYRLSASQLGFPGSPQTANQLGETVNALKQGVKTFEVTMLMADTAETIPTQHFKEMRALMKLSGVKPSVHGPMIDAAGFDEKGGWGGDEARANNERRMFDTLEKAYTLGPEGNIPVVFHASAGVPGTEWIPGDEKKGEDRFIRKRGAAINQETGQAVGISRDYKFRPGLDPTKSYAIDEATGRRKEVEGGEPGVLFSAEDSISSSNRTDWDKRLFEVAEMTRRAEDIIGDAPLNLGEYQNAYLVNGGEKIVELGEDGKLGKELPMFDPNSGQLQAYDQMRKAGQFLENAELSFNGAFHQAYKYGTEDQRKELKKLADNYSKGLNETQGQVWNPVKRQHLLDNAVIGLQNITASQAPELYKEAGEFAIDKASKTFGNLAMKSYEKLGKDNSPMIAIEPFHFGGGIAKTEEVMDLVKKSRETFAKQLVEDKGLDEKEAKKVSEQKIGVTWDVGHINMMKKYGFEDKDVLEATKKIAPMVKHIHLTDNFGYADTHLAPGMGNVPIKGILKELEKTGRLDEMRKIVEAGAFVQHFKKSPFPSSLASLGSPIYGMKNGPGWNQAMDIQGSYFGGMGTINPSQHHAMYGAGFTTMPIELGGQMSGGSSRFGGTPMA